MSTDLLLIDDSPADLRVLMDFLEARRLRVAVAFNGEEGCQRAERLQPGLILLDVRMPGLDGLSTCRRLKNHPATEDIPVIFLTVANDLQERLAGFAAGAVDYIGKPFFQEEVLARVGVHLRIDRGGDPSRFGAEVDFVNPDDDGALVSAAQAILRRMIAHPPTLDDLAHQLGTNRRRLGDAFQTRLAYPVFEWLREERLSEAYRQVCHTETPIAQIGACLGYASGANFTRAFHERFGFPPSDLRRDLKAARRTEAAADVPANASDSWS